MDWTTLKPGIVVGIIIIIAAAVIQAFKYYCSTVLFAPISEHVWVPEHDYQDLYVDGCHIWYFERNRAMDTVLFCHGNWGNISHRNYMIETLVERGNNVVVFDYKGYGKSESMEGYDILGILKDGMNVYNWLKQRVPESKIIVWGESLGGAAASYIALRSNCSKLVLWATFSRLYDIAHWGKYSFFMKLLAKVSSSIIGDYRNTECLKRVKCPVLIVHSDEDKLIPMKCAEENAKACGGRILRIKGGHSDPHLSEDEVAELFSFIEGKRVTPVVVAKTARKFRSLVEELTAKHGKKR